MLGNGGVLLAQDDLDSEDSDLQVAAESDEDDSELNPFANSASAKKPLTGAAMAVDSNGQPTSHILIWILLAFLAVGGGTGIGFFLGMSITSDASTTSESNTGGDDTEDYNSGLPVVVRPVDSRQPTERPTKITVRNPNNQRIHGNKNHIAKKTLKPTTAEPTASSEPKNQHDQKSIPSPAHNTGDDDHSNPKSDDTTNTTPTSSSSQTKTTESLFQSLNQQINYDVHLGGEKLSLGYFDSLSKDLVIQVSVDDIPMESVLEGPHKINVHYPAALGKSDDPSTSNARYESGAEHEWCISMRVSDSSNIEMVQLLWTINHLDLEPGFDRLIIRTGNETEDWIPTSITGDLKLNNKKHQAWFIEKGRSLKVCIAFESDEDDERTGVSFEWNVRIDQCEYQPKYDDSGNNIDNSRLSADRWPYLENFPQSVKDEWDSDINDIHSDVHCHVQSAVHQRWGRGPFYDGKCGTGVTENQITGNVLSSENNINIADVPGFVPCAEMKNEGINQGPYFCIKRPCGNIDNMANNDLPTKIRYGWGQINKTFNGVYRNDPYFSDPFRIYKAWNPTLKLNEYPNIQEHILTKLQSKLNDIIMEQSDERVLIRAFQNYQNTLKVKNEIGARVAHSLLKGRPFTFAFTGSSNTAGHDNMYLSTYSMQLQSVLRQLWTEIGANGASFNSRNAGMGGATNTFTHSVFGAQLTTLNTDHDYWRSDLKRLPRDQLDLFTWESSMNDGRGMDVKYHEWHGRISAGLNALYATFLVNDFCYDKKHTKEPTKGSKWSSDEMYNKPQTSVKSSGHDYMESVYGLNGDYSVMKWDLRKGIGGACYLDQSRPRYWWSKQNWHPSPIGHRIGSLNLAYTLIQSGIDFFKNHMDQITSLSPGNIYTPELDDYLIQQSGLYAQEIWGFNTDKKKLDPFPGPYKCQAFCHSIIPFTLLTHQPRTWNIAFRIFDYIRTKEWQKYYTIVDNDNEQKQWLEDLNGGLGSLDHKKEIIGNWDAIVKALAKKNLDINLEDEKAAKLAIDQSGLSLDIAIKVPPNGFGLGWLLISTGLKSQNVFENWHVMINPLNDIASDKSNNQKNNPKLNRFLKSEDCDSAYKMSCWLSGFQSGGKYLFRMMPKVKLTRKDSNKGLSMIAGM